MFSLVILGLYIALSVAFLMRTKWFRKTVNSLLCQWKRLRVPVQIFVLIFVGYMTIFATVKPTATIPEGLESTPVLIESSISGSAAITTTSKESISMLSDNGYSKLAETGDSFVSRTVTNTALTWLVMPSNAVVYSGWTNYGIAEDTFWTPATNWSFVFATNLVDGAHVSSSGTVSFGMPSCNDSFDVPKGSPTPHEMPDGTGIDFLAPFHSTLSVIPPVGRFWHSVTDSNSVRFTWQNFNVGRDTNNAISFQAELFINGDYTYRYAFPLNFLSFTNDFTIGAQFNGEGETFAMNNYSNLADGLDITWDLPDSTVDTDGDGTYDIVELYYGFDPKEYTPPDWDNDGLSNNFEYQTSLDQTSLDYNLNSSNAMVQGCDGAKEKIITSNSKSGNAELQLGIERLNARLFDSDGDKLPDIFEVTYGFNPLIANATTDETLSGDPDNDELNNAAEMAYGTNPCSSNGIPSVNTNLSSDIVNCTLELSTTDNDNDYMLIVMGESTNILLTAGSSQLDSYILPLCSTNQSLDVKISRNLEVLSNESPALSDVTARIYSMDPWVITCYGDDYLGYQPPDTYSINSTITRNSGGGEGGGTTFHRPKISVDIISEYFGAYYYYIMCGCNNLNDDLNVTALVCITSEDGMIGTPYIFNAEPITCTASGGGSIFQQDSDEDTIYFGSILSDLYNIYEYAYFTLNTGIDNLENFDGSGTYNYNISVEATAEKLEALPDSVEIPVIVEYSHSSWVISSTINPTNIINICETTNMVLDLEFWRNDCATYDLTGILYTIPKGNTDIIELDETSQDIDLHESCSTSTNFSVIGCSEEFCDVNVDICFNNRESVWARSYLTTYALAVSNLTDGISMFTGLQDAGNDGTNNINDLDNAGDFVPFLVKTHETATSAQFRFDFNDTKIRIWKKDGTMTRTNSTDSIQSGQCYEYSDLFSGGAETTFYVQGLLAGNHGVSVTYILDGRELCTEGVSVTFVDINVIIADTDENVWDELDEEKVILCDKTTKIEISVIPQFSDLTSVLSLLGNSINIKTKYVVPEGMDYTLSSENVTFSQDGNSSILRVELSNSDLRLLCVLPATYNDFNIEKAWLDHGLNDDVSDSNLSDGIAFNNNLAAETRGRSTNFDDLNSIPPNSLIDKTFFCAAGTDIITITYANTTSKRRQVMNQADYFYFSGHGSHAAASLQGGFYPDDVEGYWDKDLEYVFFAGCSVLDIEDYRAQSFSFSTRLAWTLKGGACSPGAEWEDKGPKFFIGYCWKAPLDNQGTAQIITDFFTAYNNGSSIPEAWKQANDLGIGRNACVIDTTATPHEYWYWDETSGSPIWTKITKGINGW
jgi:hypothetical protein